MSDKSEVDKVLSRVVELRKALGKAWTVVVVMFALWIVRKKSGPWRLLVRSMLIASGLGGYGYLAGFFS